MRVMTRSLPSTRGKGFLRFIVEKQTYHNLAYLALTFPLGLAYFIFLVTGFSLGGGLAVTLIGIPILAAMLAAFERTLANALLDARIPASHIVPQGPGFGARIKALVTSGTTWKGLLSLLLDFPLGIAAFVAEVTLLSLSLELIALPFSYRWSDVYYAP